MHCGNSKFQTHPQSMEIHEIAEIWQSVGFLLDFSLPNNHPHTSEYENF